MATTEKTGMMKYKDKAGNVIKFYKEVRKWRALNNFLMLLKF